MINLSTQESTYLMKALNSIQKWYILANRTQILQSQVCYLHTTHLCFLI